MKKIILGMSIVSILFSTCAGSQKKTDQESASLEAAAPEASAVVVERKVAETVPDFVLEAVKNAPPDALLGIGTMKSSNLSLAMTMARTRARAEIARQINLVFVEMVRAYGVTSETDPETVQSFRERITVTISKADVKGSSILAEGDDEDGNWWVVVIMSKEPASDVITQAQDQAAGDFPQMAGFNTGALLNDALANIVKEEIAVAR